MKKIYYNYITLIIVLVLSWSSFTNVYAQVGTSMFDAIPVPLTCDGVPFQDYKNTSSGFSDNYGYASPDVWYTFTLTGAAELEISLCGSDFDTYLHVLDQWGNLVSQSDDDGSSCTGSQSSLKEVFQAGTYYVVAEGWDVTVGNLAVSISATGGIAAPEGSTTLNPIIAGTFGTSGGTYADTKTGDEWCMGNDYGYEEPDIFYQFTLTNAAMVTLSNCGSTIPAHLYLLNSGGLQLYTIDYSPLYSCVSQQISQLLQPGTYQVVTEGYGQVNGNITTNINIAAQSICTSLSLSPSSNQNYIITYSPNKELSSSSGFSIAGVCDVQADISYYDGLGRPLQTLQVKGSPLADKDIALPVVYDSYGKETRKYLPYASGSNDGSYKSTALTDVISYYNGSSAAAGQHSIFSTPFAESRLELSPDSRPREQGAAGTDWQLGSGHTILMEYGSNAVGDVPLWTISGTGAITSGSYSANQLFRIETADENGNKNILYKDKSDKVILKKVQESVSSYLSTHYIYDEFDNLRFVLPPAVSPVSFDENSDAYTKLMYVYQYDSRNRMVKKKIPGKGWESLVYDRHDRLVATQDAIQAASTLWTFTKYDKFGRVIQTGEVTDARSGSALAAYVEGITSNWETASSSDAEGYSRDAWPQSWNKLYTVNYYDSYSFPGHPGSNYNATATGVSSNVNGLLTASRVRNLDTGDMYWTVSHFDAKGQLREIVAQNHMSGIDRIINDYNFTGQITKTSRNHSSSAVSNLPIITSYTYDHRGRKIETREQINGGIEVLLSKLEYSPIGQLIVKKLHNQLQATGYTYNERGWLKTSSSPEFSMELKYQDAVNGVTPKYNGNITNQVYTNAGAGNTFNYNYDNLNRLTRGEISPTVRSEVLSYDVMGNISSLNRDNAGANTYTYWNGSNQLRSIAGVTVTDYQYDANGNATTDGRKGVTIAYNTLNLPSTVTGSGLSMTYTYDATGRKLRKVSNMEATSDYVDGIQYTGGAIEFIMTEEGKARRNPGTPDTYSYEYNLTDHLGNVRYSFNRHPSLGTIQQLQTDNYYPFGKRFADGGVNKYLYNGKELQSELGQLDYGARFYDPEIGRWNVVDPMAEKFDFVNPYNYAVNDPANVIDPDGMQSERLSGDAAQEWALRQQARNRINPQGPGPGEGKGDGGKKRGFGQAYIDGLTRSINGIGAIWDNPKLLGNMVTPEALLESSFDGASLGMYSGLKRAISFGKTAEAEGFGTALAEVAGEKTFEAGVSLVAAGAGKVLGAIGKVAKGVKQVGKGTFIVTEEGVVLPKGAIIPSQFIENPYRSSSYGVMENGKFVEKLRIDPATPPGKKGPNFSHYHLNGSSKHSTGNWPWRTN